MTIIKFKKGRGKDKKKRKRRKRLLTTLGILGAGILGVKLLKRKKVTLPVSQTVKTEPSNLINITKEPIVNNNKLKDLIDKVVKEKKRRKEISENLVEHLMRTGVRDNVLKNLKGNHGISSPYLDILGLGAGTKRSGKEYINSLKRLRQIFSDGGDFEASDEILKAIKRSKSEEKAARLLLIQSKALQKLKQKDPIGYETDLSKSILSTIGRKPKKGSSQITSKARKKARKKIVQTISKQLRKEDPNFKNFKKLITF